MTTVGQRPVSDAMKDLLADQVMRHFRWGRHCNQSLWVEDTVIVHHYTDTPDGIQIEYEARFETDDAVDIEFDRLVLTDIWS